MVILVYNRYQVSRGSIKPDPYRLKPLQQMAPSTTKSGLQRVLGMFAYYSKLMDSQLLGHRSTTLQVR